MESNNATRTASTTATTATPNTTTRPVSDRTPAPRRPAKLRRPTSLTPPTEASLRASSTSGSNPDPHELEAERGAGDPPGTTLLSKDEFSCSTAIILQTAGLGRYITATRSG